MRYNKDYIDSTNQFNSTPYHKVNYFHNNRNRRFWDTLATTDLHTS